MKVALVEPPATHFSTNLKHLLLDFFALPGITSYLYDLGFHKFAAKLFPLNLSYIATPLFNNGIEVAIFDANIEDSIFQKIKKYSPDIVGVSCRTAPHLMWVNDLISALKKELDVKIILGGPHVTLAPYQTLETTCADFVVIGEGDEVILDLVNFIGGKKKKLPKIGIGYRSGKKIITKEPAIVQNLDSLPIPDRSLFKTNKYELFLIQTSRGCVRKCKFCYFSAFDCRWRTRSPKKVIEEVDYLINEFGVREYFFADENFTANLNITRELCYELVKRNVSWWAMGDKTLSYEDLSLMKKAGCQHFFLGIDAAPRLFGTLPKYRNVHDICQFSKK